MKKIVPSSHVEKTCIDEDIVCCCFYKKSMKIAMSFGKLLQNDMINDFNMTGFGFWIDYIDIQSHNWVLNIIM